MLICDPTIIRGNTVFKTFIMNEDKNAAALFFPFILNAIEKLEIKS